MPIEASSIAGFRIHGPGTRCQASDISRHIAHSAVAMPAAASSVFASALSVVCSSVHEGEPVCGTPISSQSAAAHGCSGAWPSTDSTRLKMQSGR